MDRHAAPFNKFALDAGRGGLRSAALAFRVAAIALSVALAIPCILPAGAWAVAVGG